VFSIINKHNQKRPERCRLYNVYTHRCVADCVTLDTVYRHRSIFFAEFVIYLSFRFMRQVSYSLRSDVQIDYFYNHLQAIIDGLVVMICWRSLLNEAQGWGGEVNNKYGGETLSLNNKEKSIRSIFLTKLVCLTDFTLAS